VKLPIPLVRLCYRLAYAGLRLYWFIARPEVNGVKCVLTNGQRVLLVRHSYGPHTWELPGGSIKRSEPPLTAARREMAEELGVTIEDWKSLGEVRGRMHHRRDVLHCFQADIPDSPLVLDPGEIVVADWFSGDQLPPDAGRYVGAIIDLVRQPA
jgi:8-oxo-dGTP pyrophosphatase MutT (NUDIX family)